jgi:multiple sugar transport system substrate-binding protein
MATIKDVAQLAGVSHGTVSNIINGAIGVSSESVRKVEEAIKALGYQPDAKARSLKTNKTMNIGVVLPNIVDSCFSQLFTGIERVLSEKQYATSLYITSEVTANEKRILTKIQQQRMDGIIIATCQPNNKKVFDQLKNTGIKVVFVEREVENSDYNFIAFNNDKAIYNTTLQLIEEGHKTIAIVSGPQEYSSEREYLKGYNDALNEKNIFINNKLIEITNLDKESSFKATIRLLQLGEIPDVIITTSTLLADGVLKAISICEVNLPKKPVVVSVSGDSWTNDSNLTIQKIQRQFMLMGEMAADILLSNIENPAFHDEKRVILDGYSTVIENKLTKPNLNKSVKTQNSLKVLMLDSSATYATYSLLADFRKKEGINVEVDILSFSELYDAIKDESLSNKYDVFEVDVPWLPEFVETGLLSDLSKYISDNPNTIDGLIPGILDVYAKYNNKFYVLPYMYGTQILFYRKDIFEDIRYQRLFYDEYHTELKPPKTWVEYNAIAKFFTKEYNPDSPTFYGTTLGGRFSSGALCEFLPRKWAYGAEAFDENGDIVFKSKETVKALKNYCESFKYASPTSPEHWWGEQVEEFCQGEAAMMVLFMSHATDITDRTKSKVVGKIGYDIIPGGKPLLGGWSLGINSNSSNKDLAFKFISWACCKDMAIPYTILGGSTPCVNLYKNPELVSIYPWLPKSLESLSLSKKRKLPKSDSGRIISERRYEEIIGEAVYKAITGQMTPEDAINNAASSLEELKISK